VHDNPTSHPEDSFECALDSDVIPLDENDDGSFSMRRQLTRAGYYTAETVDHDGELVSDSLHSFEVEPSSPDPAASTHNMVSWNSTKSLVSTADQDLQLQVFPRDRYGNKIAQEVEGYEVTMTVRSPLHPPNPPPTLTP
jgi:hypothetical protein